MSDCPNRAFHEGYSKAAVKPRTLAEQAPTSDDSATPKPALKPRGLLPEGEQQ